MKTSTQIIKEFDEKFPDITHVGCVGDFKCGTMANDVKSFIIQAMKTAVEEVTKRESTHSRGSHSDDFTDTEPCYCNIISSMEEKKRKFFDE